MAEAFKNDRAVRDYLLDRIADETERERIEELLFSDPDFADQVELAEDGIVEDYVFGRLNEDDTESFERTLPADRERRFKVQLTRGLSARARIDNLVTTQSKSSVFGFLTTFFRQPAYAGALAVVMVAAVLLTIYLTRKSGSDDLADLRSIYQQTRPTETRISGFGYAPFSQLRGAPDASRQNHLRRLENNFILNTEQSPSAEARLELGTFYLTQQKPRDAIRELEAARKLSDKDARIHNELGSAHFQLAQAGPKDKRLEELTQSLEHFTRATKLDPNLLEALFNKSLALQQLSLAREAKESWNLYLQKDPNSTWAAEARQHLARIQDEKSFFKSNQQVLSDFLAALRQGDNPAAESIHNETKGIWRSVTLPLQLSRQSLAAKLSGDRPAEKESLDALSFIGNFELTRHHDAFFLSWRTST